MDQTDMKNFLSADWGTSSFRLRLIELLTGKVLEEVMSGSGIEVTHHRWLAAGGLEEERISFYKSVLLRAVQEMQTRPQPGIPIVLSGMASSSVGIQELPYGDFPFAWDHPQIVTKKLSADAEFPYPILLISGLRTKCDIMRGEETMLFGCDEMTIKDGIVILPGTHSKHIVVKNHIALDFKTYTTGEVFNLLAQKSILSHSVSIGDDILSFEKGVTSAMNGNILNQIFMVRTRQILDKTSPISNYQYLSGLLIGTELRSVRDATGSIYLVSEAPLTDAYNLALYSLGMGERTILLSARQMLINGQCKIIEKFM